MRSKWQDENDPTWLSEVEAQVATIIQRLLLLANNTLPAHISVDQIRRFKTLYSSIGLYCRYSSCKHRCVTYRSETELKEHEFTHVRSYKCIECDFAERPFTSRQDLRKHRVKYHMTSVDLTIPLQIRSLATKSIPPLRRKTQRLGIRESNVGLSQVDRIVANDLRPKMLNTRSTAHHDPETTREYAAAPNDLNLTHTSERNDIDASNSADLVSTSSGIAHKLESGDKLKAIHFPKICSVSEASLPVGEPMQTGPETSRDHSPRMDPVVKSRQEPNTSNKNTTKAINIVHVDDSTESILKFEDIHSEGQSRDTYVSQCVQLAAKFHLYNHGIHKGRSTDEEARRIEGLIMTDSPDETRLEWHAVYFCSRRTCWSNFIGSYIDATFADENAIPGISERDIGEKLLHLIGGIGTRGGNSLYAFLDLQTKFLPQEMIRFERAMSHCGNAGTDLRTLKDKLRSWGPQRLKDYVERSLTREYLGVEERDIYDWLCNYVRESSYDCSYLYRLTDEWRIQKRVHERRKERYPNLWLYIFRLLQINNDDAGNIDCDQVTHYVLSLLCKERQPTEMVKSLKEYLKPGE